MKQSNLGQENSNIESANKKDKEDVVFAEDSAINTTVGNDGGDIPGPANKKRHGCASGCLVILLIGSAFGVLVNLAAGFFWTFNLLLLLSIVNIVCVILMFNWKIIGFWGLSISAVIIFVINLTFGVELPTAIGGLLSPVILYGILQIKRNNISSWDQLD